MLTTPQPTPTCHSSSAREVASIAAHASTDPVRITSRAPRVSIQRPASGPATAETTDPSMNAITTGVRCASPPVPKSSASAGM